MEDWATSESDRKKSDLLGPRIHRPVLDEKVKARIYKVVLTGGPCGGKTTGQIRLASFFETLGWKVFRVPETASVLLGGGVKFAELDKDEAFNFQKNLLKVMLDLERTFFDLADKMCQKDQRNILVICDRGAMDPSAYIDAEGWRRILTEVGGDSLNAVELRDNRYNQVVHMVTAAKGAEQFYTTANNTARQEDDIALAIDRDKETKEAWLGHPYFDLIDNENTRSFEDKINKLIQVVCDRANVETGDRLAPNSRKRKWLVLSFDDDAFPPYQQFDVQHTYLLSDGVGHPDGEQQFQTRLRCRGQEGAFSYQKTTRRLAGQQVETRQPLSRRDYESLLMHRDPERLTTTKKRRCFLFGHRYFQLDVYALPPPQMADQWNGVRFCVLETFTTKVGPVELPHDFLVVDKEVTGSAPYSLYHMSKRTRSESRSPEKVLHPTGTLSRLVNGPIT